MEFCVYEEFNEVEGERVFIVLYRFNRNGREVIVVPQRMTEVGQNLTTKDFANHTVGKCV